ncbi:MAG TPA: CDP-alcohol phosphatidyltransferase family protein [Ignavibacteriaceae bacterium]
MIEKNQILTISNALSFLRLLLVFPVWFSLNNFQNETYRILTFILCIVAAITDYLDGYVARKRNEITEVGKIIDPLADKILVAVLTIKLYLIGELSSYFLLIILLRDIIIFVGGIVISLKLKKVLSSNLLGKITVTAIGFVFLMVIAGLSKQHIIFIAIYDSSIFLIYTSLLGYIIRASEFLKKNKQNEHIQ